jgi:D-arabinose 1-dehydrogenase-like Zn-dependent alcohol dehydrogenase
MRYGGEPLAIIFRSKTRAASRRSIERRKHVHQRPPFKAYVIRQDENRKVSAAMEPLSVDGLDAGEVLIKVAYSSVNYKDALAATGAGKIIRRFPCVGGIDLSGTVVDSSDPRFKAGDPVIATSFDIGVAHHGGYAEYARIPAGWVVPLPEGCRCSTRWRWAPRASPRRWASCAWKTTACAPRTAR